jgi:hypothetical protein
VELAHRRTGVTRHARWLPQKQREPADDDQQRGSSTISKGTRSRTWSLQEFDRTARRGWLARGERGPIALFCDAVNPVAFSAPGHLPRT